MSLDEQLELNEYKRKIAYLYNRRSHNYDESKWHPSITKRLVKYAQIQPGQKILDMATGTGHVAIQVSQIVGSGGRVVGVDISNGMLEQARRKIKALKINNIQLYLADAETLDFSTNSFDGILCAHAFPWMENKEITLRLWSSFLKAGGLIGIHTPADRTYMVDFILRDIFEKYGVTISRGNSIGSVQKFHNILTKAGFEAIEIKTEEYIGNYISLEEAKQKWNGISDPLILQMSSDKLKKIKAEFDAELEALTTEQGIWNDGIALFAFARKS
ncbi:MAG: methyltransferase domain-containing protein [Calothrix sp. SM1_7_51]|nr:methyltransferase domain-containing protein [Calothrix sp. SM1_7_51]